MRRLILFTLMLTIIFGLMACNNAPDAGVSDVTTPDLATPLPDPPTLAPDAGEPTVALALPTTAPTDTEPTDGASADTPSPEPPTVAPTEPPTAAPTETPAEEPTPTPSPAAEAPTSEPASPTPAADASLMAPGQRATGTLAEGELQSYPYQGFQFRPAIFFVEPSRELDVELLALAGLLSSGPGLGDVTPAATANNALSGRPEIVVYSPESDGVNTFVIRAAGGSGDYTAYLFDLTSPATGMAVQQSDSVAAGETMTYEVTSNGARPVIAMADPTNLSDVVLDIFGSDGGLLTTANFSGAGGVEVAYVLPMGTTSYTVAVREVNDMPSNFDVAVVTLE